MVKPLTDERRRALRAKRILSIQYRCIKSSSKATDTRWHLSTTHDMSILGLAFLSDVPYQLDDMLEIHVVMSGILDIFKGYGRVIRVEKKATGAFYLIAIKFVKNNALTRKRKTVSVAAKRNRLKRTPQRK